MNKNYIAFAFFLMVLPITTKPDLTLVVPSPSAKTAGTCAALVAGVYGISLLWKGLLHRSIWALRTKTIKKDLVARGMLFMASAGIIYYCAK